MSRKFFISTSTTEFGGERKRLAGLLEATSRAHALHQAKFTPRGTTLLTILAEIEEANIIIQILGTDIGDTPKALELTHLLNDQRMSGFEKSFPEVVRLAHLGQVTYTQWETWLALYLNKDLKLYRLAPSSESIENSVNSNATHLERLKGDDWRRFPTTAATREGLYDEIIKDLVRSNALTPEEAEEDKFRRRREWWVSRAALVVFSLVCITGIVSAGLWLAPPPSVEITLSRVKFVSPRIGNSPDRGSASTGLNKSPLESASVLLEQSIFESIAWDKSRLSAEHAKIMAKLKGFATADDPDLEQDVVLSVLSEPSPDGVRIPVPRSVEIAFQGSGTEQAVLVVGRDGGFPNSRFLLVEPKAESVDRRKANVTAPLRFDLWPLTGQTSSLTRAESRLGFAVIVLQPRFDPPVELINLKTIPR